MSEPRSKPTSDSTSWFQQEKKEELLHLRKILEAFWDKIILAGPSKRGNVDGFRDFIKNTPPYAGNKPMQDEVDSFFEEASKGNKGEFTREKFCDKALKFGSGIISEMNDAEKLILPSLPEIKESPKRQLTGPEIREMQKYFQEANLSAAITLRTEPDTKEESKLITPDFKENQASFPYSIHSISKFFTNMLALVMVKEKVLTEDDLNKPVSEDFIESLRKLNPPFPEKIITHLKEKEITLHQLMNHKAGLGDYLENYKAAILDRKIPNIENISDFVRFAEEKAYPSKVGEFKYSNVGILLVGLAIEHAYKKKHPEKPLGYEELLYEHILEKAGIKLSEFAKRKPDNAKYNLEDKAAPDTVGSPAGGHWATTKTLAKFGDWVVRVSRDAEFLGLMERHGEEFYKLDPKRPEHKVAIHRGEVQGMHGSTAHLAISLTTESVVATLSKKPNEAFKLYERVLVDVLSGEHEKRARIGSKREEKKDDVEVYKPPTAGRPSQ